MKRGGHMIILAIDPGPKKSAYVQFSKDEEITDKGIVDNKILVDTICDLHFDLMAVEMIASYGMPVGKEVFETCVWIGRFVQMADHYGLRTELVYRKDVKMHLCNSVKAKDSNIRQALLDLLGKEKCKGVAKDIWAALGVAVTAQAREMDRIVKETGI